MKNVLNFTTAKYFCINFAPVKFLEVTCYFTGFFLTRWASLFQFVWMTSFVFRV